MNKIDVPKKSIRKLPSSKPRAFKKESPQTEENWMMRLYVAGQSARSTAAIANLRRICDRYMPGRCTVEIPKRFFSASNLAIPEETPWRVFIN